MVTSTRISDLTVNDLGGASVLALVLVATIIAMMHISQIHSTRSKEPDMAGISPNPQLNLTYPVADFEGGAQCTDCGRDLPPGSPYDTRLDFMVEDGTPVVDVVCVYCGGR